MFIEADFNPSILFFLIWGLFSWLTKNKKQKSEVDKINSSNSVTEDFSQDDIALDFSQDDIAFKNIKIIDKDFNNVHEDYDLESTSDILNDNNELENVDEVLESSDIELSNVNKNIIKANNKNWLFDSLSEKNKIRKALILNEILNKPRSINPY